MTTEEAQVPALPDRVRSVRWGHYVVRVLLLAVLLAVAGVLPGGPRTPERYRYREGEIARERVVAPYDFRVEKDEVALRREQQAASSAVPPVFMVDGRASSDLLTKFAQFREQALASVLDPSLPPAGRTARLRATGVPLSDEAATALTAPGRARHSLELLGDWLALVYDAGLVAEKRNNQLLGYDSVSVREGERESLRAAGTFYDRREAAEFIGRRAATAFAGDPQGMKLVNELAAAFLQPNVLHD